MAETLYDAMRSSRNPYQTMMLKQIVTSDEMFGVVPFVPKTGEGFSYEREVSLGSFAAIAPGGAPAESTGRTERVTVSNREFTADLYVPNFAQEGMADIISPVERQTMMKLKAAGRTLAGKFITGGSVSGATIGAFDSGAYAVFVSCSPYCRTSDRSGPGSLKYVNAGTLLSFRAPGDQLYGTAVVVAGNGTYTLKSQDPSKYVTLTITAAQATVDQERLIAFTASNEFDGIQNFVTSGQTSTAAGADGDALSFGVLEAIRDAVKVRDGRLAFVMNLAMRRKYNSIVRATNAAGPSQVELEGMQYPTFDGIPILANDNIPSTESKGASTTLSSVYCVNFSSEAGLYCGAFGGPTQVVTADPRDVTVLGFRIFELGQIQATAQKGRRISWFGGMALGSDLSLARASQLLTA